MRYQHVGNNVGAMSAGRPSSTVISPVSMFREDVKFSTLPVKTSAELAVALDQEKLDKNTKVTNELTLGQWERGLKHKKFDGIIFERSYANAKAAARKFMPSPGGISNDAKNALVHLYLAKKLYEIGSNKAYKEHLNSAYQLTRKDHSDARAVKIADMARAFWINNVYDKPQRDESGCCVAASSSSVSDEIAEAQSSKKDPRLALMIAIDKMKKANDDQSRPVGFFIFLPPFIRSSLESKSKSEYFILVKETLKHYVDTFKSHEKRNIAIFKAWQEAASFKEEEPALMKMVLELYSAMLPDVLRNLSVPERVYLTLLNTLPEGSPEALYENLMDKIKASPAEFLTPYVKNAFASWPLKYLRQVDCLLVQDAFKGNHYNHIVKQLSVYKKSGYYEEMSNVFLQFLLDDITRMDSAKVNRSHERIVAHFDFSVRILEELTESDASRLVDALVKWLVKENVLSIAEMSIHLKCLSSGNWNKVMATVFQKRIENKSMSIIDLHWLLSNKEIERDDELLEKTLLNTTIGAFPRTLPGSKGLINIISCDSGCLLNIEKGMDLLEDFPTDEQKQNVMDHLLEEIVIWRKKKLVYLSDLYSLFSKEKYLNLVLFATKGVDTLCRVFEEGVKCGPHHPSVLREALAIIRLLYNHPKVDKSCPDTLLTSITPCLQEYVEDLREIMPDMKNCETPRFSDYFNFPSRDKDRKDLKGLEDKLERIRGIQSEIEGIKTETKAAKKFIKFGFFDRFVYHVDNELKLCDGKIKRAKKAQKESADFVKECAEAKASADRVFRKMR